MHNFVINVVVSAIVSLLALGMISWLYVEGQPGNFFITLLKSFFLWPSMVLAITKRKKLLADYLAIYLALVTLFYWVITVFGKFGWPLYFPKLLLGLGVSVVLSAAWWGIIKTVEAICGILGLVWENWKKGLGQRVL